jgi:adenylate cyclase class IV
MIEFELKYKICRIPDVLLDFQSINSKHVMDIYYDTSDFKLIKNGNFFRCRNNNKIDFKVDIADNQHLYADERCFSIDDISSNNSALCNLLQKLNIVKCSKFDNLTDLLDKNDFIVIAKIDKNRTNYVVDNNIYISIDDVNDLGLFLEAEIRFDYTFNSTTSEKVKKFIISKLKDKCIINEFDTYMPVGYVELYLMKYNKYVYELGKFKL